jgi:hypothetical protein
MTITELEQVRDWAIERLTTGNEPPWSWYQLMKLREASEALLAGMETTQPTVDLQESEQRRGAGLRLVGATCRPETAQPHQAAVAVQLPT